MNNTIHKSILFFLIIISIINFSCYNHEHGEEDGHDHTGHDHSSDKGEGADDHSDHEDEETGPKTVILNEAQYKNAEVELGWFEQKNISNVIRANGHTRLAAQNQADVSMPIGGMIKEIKVIEGKYVKKGQVLAIMLSLDYNKMLLDRSKVQQDIDVTQTQINYLRIEYKRQQELANESINAKKVFDKVNADLRTEEARLNALNQQMIIQEETMSLISDTNSPSLRVKSPISGYVTGINVHIGSSVAVGQKMFSIIDNSKMHVDLLVYEKDLSKVKVGQNVRFILTNQSNKEISGKIYNIGKSFENETKSVAVHADIEKQDKSLIPDMYINALIDIGNDKVSALPTGAIIMAEGRKFVFVLDKDAAEHEHEEGDDHEEHEDEFAFKRLEVKTGAEQLGYTEVIPLEGIIEGDKIVTKGAYYLQSHLLKSEGGGGHHH
jgi:cobalt-zinc-cadmium efflux system membrane fusion protein